MGSSRAWYQYNPCILDSINELKFYNFGSNGQLIDYQILRYDTFRKYNPKPKYIIQNIDFLTLGLCKSVYSREQFLPYIFDDSLISMVKKTQKITWVDIHFPLIRYSGYEEIIENGFMAYFGKTKFDNGGLIKGYRGCIEKWDGTKINEIKTLEYCKNVEAIALFEKYLSNAKNEGIKVVLVSAPVYIEATKKIHDLKGMKLMFNTIAIRHNLKILDYTNDSICYDTINFANSTHLNKKGAELFTTKLANDLKAMKFFDEKK